MWDPDLQIGGRSSRPWDERGRAVSKEIFRPFGPHFGLKLRRGAGPQSLSPGSATGYGIEGSLLQWFRNFLTNRQQRVVVRGTTSLSSVKSGVSQGTILGPILFLIYVNDTSSNISWTIKLFADDTIKVNREIADSINDTPTLQTESWDLIRRNTKQRALPITLTSHHPLRILWGVEIKPVKCVKDLGVLISYDLSWGAQVDAAVNKANNILGIVYRTPGPTNQEASILHITLVWIRSPSVVSIPSKRYTSTWKGPEEGISHCAWTKAWGNGPP